MIPGFEITNRPGPGWTPMDPPADLLESAPVAVVPTHVAGKKPQQPAAAPQLKE